MEDVMATREQVRKLVGELFERDPEGIYSDSVDTYEFEEAEPLLRALTADADYRRQVLIEAAEVRRRTFGGRAFPESFVACVGEYGFSNITDHEHAINLWMQSLDWDMHMDAAQYARMTGSFTQSVRFGGRPAEAFEFVDNPGDMPGYGFIGLLQEPTGDDEALWLYRGWDLSWEDGSVLAPMGRTFWDVAYLALTGLADALYVPSREFEATLGRLRGVPEEWRAELAMLGALSASVAGLPLSIDDTYAEEPFSWSAQIARLDARIVAINQHMSR